MDTGSLDRRVTLMRPVMGDDGFSSTVTGYAASGQRWGSKLDVSDRERIAAAQQNIEVTTRFRFRWDSLTASLNSAWQLVCGGVTYQIGAVKEIGRHEGVEVTAARSDNAAA